MNMPVDELVQGVSSDEEAIRQEALLQTALLLEQERYTIDSRAIVSRQETLIQALMHLLTEDTSQSTAMWALGKANPTLGIRPLLDLLPALVANHEEETLYQALIALDNFLVMHDNQLLPVVASELRRTHTADLLNALAKSTNDRLAGQAVEISASLDRKLPPILI